MARDVRYAGAGVASESLFGALRRTWKNTFKDDPNEGLTQDAQDIDFIEDLKTKYKADPTYRISANELKRLEELAKDGGGNAFVQGKAEELLEDVDVFEEQAIENEFPESSISDPAAGGVKQDPETVKTAVDESKNEEADEVMDVTDNREYPTLKSFSDQTYILMQMSNILNLRIDKTDKNPEVKRQLIIKKQNGKNPKNKKSDVTRLTRAALTSPLPYAYIENDAGQSYGNAIIQCYGEPYSFVNYLTSDPRYQGYLDLKPDKLSRLQPKIRLFKEFNSEGKLDIVEIKFPTDGIESKNVLDPYTDKSTSELEEFLNGRRGYGVGIENFTFTIDGTNPVTRDRSVSATLTLVANSLDDLLKPRRGKSIRFPESKDRLAYKYYDLAMHTDTGNKKREGPSDESTKFGMINDLDFRILAEIGISENTDVSELSQLNSTTLSLGRINHTYQIGQDGKVTLNIEYKGYIEKEYQNPVVWDCFATRESMKNDLKKQLSEILLKDSCEKAQIKQFHKMNIVTSDSDFRNRVTSISDALRDAGKIVYYELTTKEFKAYNTIFNNHDANIKSIKENDEAASELKKKQIKEAYKVLQEHLTAAHEEIKKTKTDSKDTERAELKKAATDESGEGKKGEDPCKEIDANRTQVSFFFAGDLINLILKQMGDIYSVNTLSELFGESLKELKNDEMFKELMPDNTNDAINEDFFYNLYAKAGRFQKLRIVLGPTQFGSLLSNDQPMASIGDVPIALDYFNSWLARSVKGKQLRYPLSSFLKDFVTVFIPKYLRGTPEENDGLISFKKTYSSVPFTAYNPPNLPDELQETDALTAYRAGTKGKSLNGLVYEKIDQSYRPILDQTSKTISSNKRLLNSYDYLVFHEKRSDPIYPKMGRPTRQIDNAFGIFHYQQGVDRGILKNIEFKATNIEGRREARFQKGKFNGLAQLTEVFDATLETFLDLNIYPGTKIYIDSDTLVSHLSAETRELLGDYKISEFGLGGYYIVNSVTHNFGPGIFTTTFQAQWDSWQHKRPQTRKTKEKPDEKVLKAKEKCKASLEAAGASQSGSLADLARSILQAFGLDSGSIDTLIEFAEDAGEKLQGYTNSLAKLLGGN